MSFRVQMERPHTVPRGEASYARRRLVFKIANLDSRILESRGALSLSTFAFRVEIAPYINNLEINSALRFTENFTKICRK